MLGLIYTIYGLGAALWMAMRNKKKPAAPQDLSIPNYASSSVVNAIDQNRRSVLKRKGRAATNVTGGLSSSGTLGGASLWGA